MDNTIAFRIAFFVLIGAMLAVRIVFNMRVRKLGERVMPDKEAIRREGIALFAMRFILFFFLMAIMVLYAINHPWMHALDFTLPEWARWVGLGVGLMSIALLIWTELELGRQFSPQLQLRQDHQLITSGPYAHIRHPLYTAIYAFGLSLALVSANWFFAAFFLVSLMGLAARVPKEEKMMLEQFGEEYRLYMERTRRYWPKM